MASTRRFLVALFVTVAFVSLEGAPALSAAGTAGRSSPVRLRRRQVQSLLRQLNKAPLTTIESPDGDIIDCVHVSKQPAFDHPLLKNHTIQMRPSYHPGDLYDSSSITPHPITQTWQQSGKCPDNTIPIRRTKEGDFMSASSIRRHGKKRPLSIPSLNSLNDPGTPNHAVASTTTEDKYYGTSATINLWQPRIEGVNDFSLSQLWIIAGSYKSNDLNTVEAGWQVSQEIYGDTNTRFFIYWTRDAYETTGCYNLLCSGFIQINNQITIGGSISPVSIYGGSQYDIKIFVWKDQKDGNWWLQVGSYVLGYWPSSLFSYLADSASSIMWGGEVYTPGSNQTYTQMGSGHFPEEGFRKASYIKNLQVIDSSNNIKSPNVVDFTPERPNCYNLTIGNNSDWGTYIYYGGACESVPAAG
ncbi:hypothetical protein PVAP13_4KG125300, partial [Panicum virgatum]